MTRVLALLNPYFEKDTAQSVRIMEAEDWAACLSEYPMFAIQNAARWWKGENKKRSTRPLEGDIADRARAEMQIVRDAAAGIKLAAMKRSEPEPQRDDTPLTPEQRAVLDATLARFAKGRG